MRRLVLDSSSLGDLFDAQADDLLRYFTRRTFDAEAAFDLVAETFAQAVASRVRFRGSTEDEARAWLYGIAHHKYVDYVRRGQVERRAMAKLAVERLVVEDHELAELERRADLEELRRCMAGPIRALPPDQRAALELRVVHERSYAEVAQRLNITEQTARARVSRALRKLASTLTAPTPSLTTEETR